MCEQRANHTQVDLCDSQHLADRSIREHLAAIDCEDIDNALRTWRKHWDRTVLRPASTASHGLYRDRSLVYWVLGNAMNRSNDLIGPGFSAESSEGQWTLKIPRLLKTLSVLADSGKLDTGEGDSDGAESLDCYLRDLQSTAESDPGDKEIDTVILNYMMRRGGGRVA